MSSKQHPQPPLTLESIESAINQIDAKKESLKNAFEELQHSQSSLIASLSLSWPDLDAHFTSVQQSLSHQFRLLQSLQHSHQHQTSSSSSSGSGTRVEPEDEYPLNSDPEGGDPSGSKVGHDVKDSVLSQVDPGGSKSEPKNGDPFGSEGHWDGKKSGLSRVGPAGSNDDLKNGDPSVSKVHPDGKKSVLSWVDWKPDLKNGDLIEENIGSGQVEPGRDLFRVELRGLCERMDGEGLREYIDEHRDECDQIRVELAGAMECASDPALLVLDAVESSFSEMIVFVKRRKKKNVMKGCHMMLETLGEMRSIEVSGEVRARAKRLVSEWKRKEKTRQGKKFHLMGLLKLVVAFRLGAELSLEEFVDYLIAAKPQQPSNLCQLLGFGNKIIDIIQKILSRNVTLLALELVINFELTKQFPLVPILKSYISDSKKRAKKVREDGKYAGWAEKAAISVELNVLKAVFKFIGDHNLESEYPRADLEKLIEELEEQKAFRKQPPEASTSRTQQHKEHKRKQQSPQSQNKRHRMMSALDPREVLALHQSHLGSAGLLPDRRAIYLSSSVVPDRFAGSAPSVVPLTASVGLYGSAGTSAGIYGPAGIPAGIYGNQIPSGSQLHPSRSYISSATYDRLTALGGYGASPQYYHPNYHP